METLKKEKKKTNSTTNGSDGIDLELVKSDPQSYINYKLELDKRERKEKADIRKNIMEVIFKGFLEMNAIVSIFSLIALALV